MTIHFGVLVPQGWKGEFAAMSGEQGFASMIGTAVEAERLGWDSAWLYDHFHSVPPPARPIPVFECWTGMMALAMATSTIRIGQMVTCTPYRNPAYLAKVSACVDVASGGRLEMGVGAGWYWQEFEAYGYDFASNPDRIGHLEDTCEILTRMWRDEAATYQGAHASVTEAYCDPKPIQRPRPPIWVGGGGERKTLRVTAKHGDYANWSVNAEGFVHKRDVLAQHCEAVGRDPAQITLTYHGDALVTRDDAGLRRALDAHPSIWGASEEARLKSGLVGTVNQVIDKIGTYVDAGCRGFVVWLPDYPSHETLALFAEEVIPAFR